MHGLTIGEVAAQGDVRIETLRYYERRGLLNKPPRSVANYRLYPADAVRRVRFIKRAQELGFSLREIKELLSLRAAPRSRCEDVRKRATAKIDDIEQKIRSLRAMKHALSKLVAQCAGAVPISNCPILEALDADGNP
ncbi:MAG: MerR family DNA-binding protein [Candidatus Binatia bacterium]